MPWLRHGDVGSSLDTQRAVLDCDGNCTLCSDCVSVCCGSRTCCLVAILWHGSVAGHCISDGCGQCCAALKLLHKLGLRRIVLDKLDEWQPKQAALQKSSRPDRAQALSRAAKYDRWVNAKVQSSRDDPRPAVAEVEWQPVRQAKLAQRQALHAGCAAPVGTWAITQVFKKTIFSPPPHNFD